MRFPGSMHYSMHSAEHLLIEEHEVGENWAHKSADIYF